MEMCYGGALVMPSNYVAMSEDEMMYVDGGAWSAKRVWCNIIGAAGQYAVVKWCAKKVNVFGKSVWNWVCQGVNWAKNKVVTALGALFAKLNLQAATVSRILAVVVSLSTIAAVVYLGNNRVFY